MPKRRTTQEFIEKSKALFGPDAFDYSSTFYVESKAPLVIICKKHTKEITVTPEQHYRKKYGCRACADVARTSNADDFVAKATIVHGTLYDYNDVVYVGKDVHVSIRCTRCTQAFQQSPHSHLNGCGCPTCSNLTRGRVRMTQKSFIEKASIKHSDIDYAGVHYVDYNTKVILRCERHNKIYQQSPKKHLQQRGCPMCSQSNFSLFACQWLDYKQKEEGQHIQHALSGGEYHIPGVGNVDGFCKALNKVFEFHGSFYHGNPGHEINRLNKKMMCELYFKTIERELKIRALGYAYEEVWDIDWSRTMRSAKIIQHAWACYKQNRPFRRLDRYGGHTKQ